MCGRAFLSGPFSRPGDFVLHSNKDGQPRLLLTSSLPVLQTSQVSLAQATYERCLKSCAVHTLHSLSGQFSSLLLPGEAGEQSWVPQLKLQLKAEEV
jgi:hypothetical protein